MSFTHVLSELGTGLRRNVSMTVSLVVTLAVSVSLVGVGLLLQQQIETTEQYWGDRLQIQVEMCSPNSLEAACIDGAATDAQQAQVEDVIVANSQVETYEFVTSAEEYERAEQIFGQSNTGRRLFEALRPESFPSSFYVTLEDPNQIDVLASELEGVPGVDHVRDLRDLLDPLYQVLGKMRWIALGVAATLMIAAVLQVANTIRLAAFARRREIGIMRLVGASSWHIQLPFVLESMLAALVGAAAACGVLALFMGVVVQGYLAERLGTITPWVDWGDAVLAGTVTVVFAIIVAVIPTLVMTRKYLDV
ncbi:MAG: permease-like cell division protein FtsX [Actinomycetota bacterium]|nr:permease-like cell division protein FtsX [Actinomycetota bacterium]